MTIGTHILNEGIQMLVGAQQWKNVFHSKNAAGIAKNLGEALFMDVTLVLPGVDEARVAVEGLYLTYVAGDAERASKVVSLSRYVAASNQESQAKNFMDLMLDKQVTRTVEHVPAQEARPREDTAFAQMIFQPQVNRAAQEVDALQQKLLDPALSESDRTFYERQIEESEHNKQKAVESWVYEPATKGGTIERVTRGEYYHKITDFRSYVEKYKLWNAFGESLHTGKTDDLFAQQNESIKRYESLRKQRSHFLASEDLGRYKSAFNFLKEHNEEKGFSRFIFGNKVQSIGYLQRRNMLMYYSAVSLTNEGISYFSQDD